MWMGNEMVRIPHQGFRPGHDRPFAKIASDVHTTVSFSVCRKPLAHFHHMLVLYQRLPATGIPVFLTAGPLGPPDLEFPNALTVFCLI